MIPPFPGRGPAFPSPPGERGMPARAPGMAGSSGELPPPIRRGRIVPWSQFAGARVMVGIRDAGRRVRNALS